MSERAEPVDPARVEAIRTDGLPAGEGHHLSGLLTLLADPLRARLLAALLVTDEVCVGDLAIALGASEDASSYGLRLLRTAGLVRHRREGRLRYYRIPQGPARDALAASLSLLRQLGALHPEATADDLDER